MDIPGLLDPFDAGSGMNDVQHLNALLANTVNNQVGIQNDVPVHTGFRSQVTAFGVIGISPV